MTNFCFSFLFTIFSETPWGCSPVFLIPVLGVLAALQAWAASMGILQIRLHQLSINVIIIDFGLPWLNILDFSGTSKSGISSELGVFGSAARRDHLLDTPGPKLSIEKPTPSLCWAKTQNQRPICGVSAAPGNHLLVVIF